MAHALFIDCLSGNIDAVDDRDQDVIENEGRNNGEFEENNIFFHIMNETAAKVLWFYLEEGKNRWGKRKERERKKTAIKIKKEKEKSEKRRERTKGCKADRRKKSSNSHSLNEFLWIDESDQHLYFTCQTVSRTTN